MGLNTNRSINTDTLTGLSNVNVISPSSGNSLVYNGTTWEAHTLTITGLENQIIANSGRIDVLEVDYSGLSGYVVLNSGRIDDNSVILLANSGRIDVLEFDYSGLSGDVIANSGRIDINETDITSNSGRIDTNKTDISVNSGRIDTNESNITFISGDYLPLSGGTVSGDISIVGGVLEAGRSEVSNSGVYSSILGAYNAFNNSYLKINETGSNADVELLYQLPSLDILVVENLNNLTADRAYSWPDRNGTIALTDIVTDNSGRIDNNESGISANSGRIDTNESNITANSGRIDTLENHSYVTITLDYDFASNVDIAFANASGGNLTVGLPSGVSGILPKKIKKIDSTDNYVIVSGVFSQQIDGDTTATLVFENDSITCAFDGSDWFII